jgi:hypothetical protein
MTTVVALLWCLVPQEPPPPERRPFRAELTIERFVKREDGVTMQTGALSVRPGEALAFETGRSRLVVRGGSAVERRAGERGARRWDLSKPENFQPIDLWRMDAADLRRQFRVITDRPSERRDLPSSVVTSKGAPVPPAAVKPRGSLVVVDGVDLAEGCARVILVPVDPRLRERVASIRLSVDRATGLLLRAVVDSPAQVLTLTIGEYREVASLDDATFEIDLSNLNVEER